MRNETLLVINYITNFHWVWYGLGFLVCPRLTIMIMLQIYFKEFIGQPLMLIGWIVVILSLFSGGNKK